MNEQQLRNHLDDLAGRIAVGPAPVAAVVVAAQKRPARRWLAALGGFGIVVGAIGSAVVLGNTLGGDQAPPKWDSESARYFNLPDGDAQIGVSTGGDGVVVRWRDPDGETWSDPEVVFDADGMEWIYSRIRVGGPTLAMYATYSPSRTTLPVGVDIDEASEEDWEQSKQDDVTVFIACRDGSCGVSDRYGVIDDDAPQVTGDGDRALFTGAPGRYVTWHDGDFQDQRPTGLPDTGLIDGQPLLTPDGSLRAVYGVPDSGGCVYSLLTTEPGGAAFTESATYQDPTDHRNRCEVGIETFASDYLVVSRSTYRAWYLARVDGVWQRVTEDPSGQVHYPRTGDSRIAGAVARAGFWHWRQSVATSPDGRTLIVQMHFPGEERWGEPQVVARARRGEQCISIDPMPTYTDGEEDPFYINLTCRSRPSPGADWVYSYPTAVTEDGRTWTSFQATDSGLRIGNDMLFRGRPNYWWSQAAGIHKVDLPVPRQSLLALLEDGTFALVGVPDRVGGCDVVVRLAGPDDTEWSEPVRSTADRIPKRFCSADQVDTFGQNLHVYVGGRSRDSWQVRMKWRDGSPVLEDGLRDCFDNRGQPTDCPEPPGRRERP